MFLIGTVKENQFENEAFSKALAASVSKDKPFLGDAYNSNLDTQSIDLSVSAKSANLNDTVEDFRTNRNAKKIENVVDSFKDKNNLNPNKFSR